MLGRMGPMLIVRLFLESALRFDDAGIEAYHLLDKRTTLHTTTTFPRRQKYFSSTYNTPIVSEELAIASEAGVAAIEKR